MILITPADGSLPAFRLGRTPQYGDSRLTDPGQVVGPTDGTDQFVQVTRLKRHQFLLELTNLEDADYYYLREYLSGTLRGGKERFTLEYGLETNLLTSSERFDPATTNWIETQAWTTVTDENQAGPRGYTDASRMDFDASQGFGPVRHTNLGLSSGDLAYLRLLARIIGSPAETDVSIGTDEAIVARALPADGAFHWVEGAITVSTSTYISIHAGVTVPVSIAVARAQVSLGSRPRPYQKMPRPGGANCMVWPSRLQAKRGKAGWNLRIPVRQEVVPT